MRHSGKYQIDRGILLQKAYYLLCFFFADKEIARRTAPHELLSILEQRFFESEASRVLLELAIGMHVIDDQIKKLAPNNLTRTAYQHRSITANALADACLNSADKATTFREMCNKIIHSDVLEPHLERRVANRTNMIVIDQQTGRTSAAMSDLAGVGIKKNGISSSLMEFPPLYRRSRKGRVRPPHRA